MKAAAIFLLSALLILGAFAVAPADDRPQSHPTFGQPGAKPPAQSQARPSAVGQPPQRFYGYVPPPPILHTWPGGYRVIRRDVSNVLADHIGGHY